MSTACRKSRSMRRAVLTLVAVGAIACGDDEGQFVIVQNQVPQIGCVISSDVTGMYRGGGVLDVALVRDGANAGYVLFPLLQNNYPKRATGADLNRMRLAGARVRVRPLDAPDAVTSLFNQLATSPQGQRLIAYDEPWSGTVDSGGGTTAMSVNAFPAELARRVRALGLLERQTRLRFMLDVSALAEGPDGDLSSDEFHYPLELCQNCLVASAPLCPAVATARGNACNVAQDEPVDCCLAGTALACPAVGP